MADSGNRMANVAKNCSQENFYQGMYQATERKQQGRN